MIEATLKMLRKNRGFSDDAEDQRNRMETTRHNIGDNMEAMLVRGHTNIIYWGESEQQVKEYRTIVTNFLKQQRHFEPVVPTGVELRNVVYCSNPATVACMDSDAYYIADITQAIALFQNVGDTSRMPRVCSSAILWIICRFAMIFTMRIRSMRIRGISPWSV